MNNTKMRKKKRDGTKDKGRKRRKKSTRRERRE